MPYLSFVVFVSLYDLFRHFHCQISPFFDQFLSDSIRFASEHNSVSYHFFCFISKVSVFGRKSKSGDKFVNRIIVLKFVVEFVSSENRVCLRFHKFLEFITNYFWIFFSLLPLDSMTHGSFCLVLLPTIICTRIVPSQICLSGVSRLFGDNAFQIYSMYLACLMNSSLLLGEVELLPFCILLSYFFFL